MEKIEAVESSLSFVQHATVIPTSASSGQMVGITNKSEAIDPEPLRVTRGSSHQGFDQVTGLVRSEYDNSTLNAAGDVAKILERPCISP